MKISELDLCNMKFLLLLTVLFFFATSCSDVSIEQRAYWMKRAEQGDPKALFHTSTNSGYLMPRSVRDEYLLKSAELGYAPAIDYIILELFNSKDDAYFEWIKFGVNKDSKVAKYYLGRIYYDEGTEEYVEQGKKLIEESASKGFKPARITLRMIKGKKENLFYHIIDEFWHTWYSTEGYFIGRLSASSISAVMFFIPYGLESLISSYKTWWKGLLITVLFLSLIIGYIYLLFQHRKIEWAYSRSERTLVWVPLVFLAYGCILTFLSDFGYKLFRNVGRIFQTEETSSFVGTIAVFMTWILLCVTIYSIIVILKDKTIVKNKIIRLLMLALYCWLNFIAGIFLSIIIAVIVLISIVKGWYMDPNNKSLIPGGNDSNGSCRHKSISGWCQRKDREYCKVEEGGSCPFGML